MHCILPFNLLKVFIFPAPRISPPLLDYSSSMQTCFCLPSTQNQNNSLDTHTLFQLPPFSLTSKLAYTSRLHFLTSHSLLYLFHLIFCPYCFLKLFLSVKISNGLRIVKSNGYFCSYWVQPLSSSHLVGQSLFLEMLHHSIHTSAFIAPHSPDFPYLHNSSSSWAPFLVPPPPTSL